MNQVIFFCHLLLLFLFFILLSLQQESHVNTVARTTIMQPRYGRSILQLTVNITLITNHEMIQLPIARELQC